MIINSDIEVLNVTLTAVVTTQYTIWNLKINYFFLWR